MAPFPAPVLWGQEPSWSPEQQPDPRSCPKTALGSRWHRRGQCTVAVPSTHPLGQKGASTLGKKPTCAHRLAASLRPEVQVSSCPAALCSQDHRELQDACKGSGRHPPAPAVGAAPRTRPGALGAPCVGGATWPRSPALQTVVLLCDATLHTAAGQGRAHQTAQSQVGLRPHTSPHMGCAPPEGSPHAQALSLMPTASGTALEGPPSGTKTTENHWGFGLERKVQPPRLTFRVHVIQDLLFHHPSCVREPPTSVQRGLHIAME